jgi:fructuronate reductase
MRLTVESVDRASAAVKRPQYARTEVTPGIVADLKAPRNPSTVAGIIAEALRRRMEADLAPFAVLSCDNLPHNGAVTARVVTEFAEAVERKVELLKMLGVAEAVRMVARKSLRGMAQPTPSAEDRFLAELLNSLYPSIP